jgi:hypothetical protein
MDFEDMHESAKAFEEEFGRVRVFATKLDFPKLGPLPGLLPPVSSVSPPGLQTETSESFSASCARVTRPNFNQNITNLRTPSSTAVLVVTPLSHFLPLLGK